MYWTSFFIDVGLGVMDQVQVQDLLADCINECIGSSRDMSENDDFKMSHEKIHSEIFIEEKWMKDTKDIVEL